MSIRFINPWPLIVVFLALLIPGGHVTQINRQIGQTLLEWKHRVVAVTSEPSIDTPEAVILRVMKDLEQGRFQEANGQIADYVRRSPTKSEQILPLQRQLQERLHLTINFRTIAGQTVGSPISSSGNGVVLRSGDSYKLDYTPAADCYLYVYQVDSRGQLDQLFPHPEYSPERNPLQAGKTYSLPAGDEWFRLDQHTGQETIYFVASRWPSVPWRSGSRPWDATRGEETIYLVAALWPVPELESRGPLVAEQVIPITRAFQTRGLSHIGKRQVSPVAGLTVAHDEAIKKIEGNGGFAKSVTFLHQ